MAQAQMPYRHLGQYSNQYLHPKTGTLLAQDYDAFAVCVLLMPNLSSTLSGLWLKHLSLCELI